MSPNAKFPWLAMNSGNQRSPSSGRESNGSLRPLTWYSKPLISDSPISSAVNARLTVNLRGRFSPQISHTVLPMTLFAIQCGGLFVTTNSVSSSHRTPILSTLWYWTKWVWTASGRRGDSALPITFSGTSKNPRRPRKGTGVRNLAGLRNTHAK
jgi:hypothetical protein